MKRLRSISILLSTVYALSFSQTTLIINKNNGSPESFPLSDVKAISFKTNLVKNGDFSDSLNNWLLIGNGTNPYHPTDPGRADFSTVNGVLTIDIKNQGTWEFSIMAYQSVPFENAAYIVSFDAMSDSAMQIISNVTQDGSWVNFSGDRVFDVSPIMASYSYEFTMPAAGAALFQFCLGNLGLRKIYIDNIAIRKK